MHFIEQQSSWKKQLSPTAPHAWAHIPFLQLFEQHSPSLLQGSPSIWQAVQTLF